MSRESYRGATPETKQALEGAVKEIAYEMEIEPQYLYAILAGKESDPFKRFKRMFRAVCRKRKESARGYLARLTTIFNEENPRTVEQKPYDVSLTFNDMISVGRLREEGLRTAEEFEAAKARHIEAVARFDAGVQIVGKAMLEQRV
jgi:hypothetical protein